MPGLGEEGKEPADGASGRSWKPFQYVFEETGKGSMSWGSVLP